MSTIGDEPSHPHPDRVQYAAVDEYIGSLAGDPVQYRAMEKNIRDSFLVQSRNDKACILQCYDNVKRKRYAGWRYLRDLLGDKLVKFEKFEEVYGDGAAKQWMKAKVATPEEARKAEDAARKSRAIADKAKEEEEEAQYARDLRTPSWLLKDIFQGVHVTFLNDADLEARFYDAFKKYGGVPMAAWTKSGETME
eukprot:gene18674-55422_t